MEDIWWRTDSRLPNPDGTFGSSDVLHEKYHVGPFDAFSVPRAQCYYMDPLLLISSGRIEKGYTRLRIDVVVCLAKDVNQESGETIANAV